MIVTPVAKGHDVSETRPPVRWNNGVLEHACTITTYRDGCPVAMRIEWRAVPTEPIP